MIEAESESPDNEGARGSQPELFKRLWVAALVCPVREVRPQLKDSLVAPLDIVPHVVVDAGNRVCGKHLDDDVALPSLGAHAQVYHRLGVCVGAHMGLHIDWFVRV